MIRKTILQSMACLMLMLAMLAMSAALAEGNLTELRPGASGEQVSQYQQRLVHYGYLETATGTFDNATSQATTYFQAANKVMPSGTATSNTRALINKNGGVVSYDSYQVAQKSSGFKLGASGLDVKMVQQRLADLGYYKGPINGNYSTASAKAVVLFKKFNNFKTASHTVTSADRDAIDDLSALSYGEVYGPDTLKPGDRGTEVLEAQIVLRELGYYTKSLNGQFNTAMSNGVKNFQKANRLYPTGYLLSPTRAILDKYIERSDSTNVDPRAHQAIDVAQTLLGRKYQSGSSGPSTFDCSGFTYYVFKKVGVSLVHSASGQSKRGKLITARNLLLPGDLVFFATGSSATSLNHVGMVYSVEDDNIKFIHASSSGGRVMASAFKDNDKGDFYNKRFLWARRVW